MNMHIRFPLSATSSSALLKRNRVSLAALLVCCCLVPAVSNRLQGQTLQKGGDASARGEESLRFDYISFRAAACEMQHVHEPENERPNQAGLITVYYTNITDEPLQLAYWRANQLDESHWRLGGFLAWDRNSGETLLPGQTGWLEINAVSEEFAPGSPFDFVWVSSDKWVPVGRVKGTLAEDPVQVSYIRLRPGLADLEVHVRFRGQQPIEFSNLQIENHTTTEESWRGQRLQQAGHAIGRAKLDRPLPLGEPFVVRFNVEQGGDARVICSHRRAFADVFPIGTWGAEPERYAELRQYHIDTCVKDGSRGDEFFGRDAQAYGLRAIVSGHAHSLESLRGLGDHPSVAGVMLADEPDWKEQPAVMLAADRLARHFNPRQPTMITLCRNVKFFEYASLPDIPCQDHYCVAAPSSSQWPENYGTRLEETGYYTRDLKRASEPKAVWVWTQGLFNWSGRPGQQVATPDELAVQLLQNLGHGAKGNLWFTFREESGEEYPKTKQAIQGWGRVMRLIREDLLSAEPATLPCTSAEQLDVLPLLGWDRVFVIVTNRDYELDPNGYRWHPVRNARLELTLPDWIKPQAVAELGPEGLRSIAFHQDRQMLRLKLDKVRAYRLIMVLNDSSELEHARQSWDAIVADESR